MKRIISCFFVAFFVFAAECRAADQGEFLAIDGAPARYVLPAYERITGKTVTVTAEVKSSQKPIFLSFVGKKKEEALRLIERALLDQADVELVHQADGTVLAKHVLQKKKA